MEEVLSDFSSKLITSVSLSSSTFFVGLDSASKLPVITKVSLSSSFFTDGLSVLSTSTILSADCSSRSSVIEHVESPIGMIDIGIIS